MSRAETARGVGGLHVIDLSRDGAAGNGGDQRTEIRAVLQRRREIAPRQRDTRGAGGGNGGRRQRSRLLERERCGQGRRRGGRCYVEREENVAHLSRWRRRGQ